MLHLNLNTWLKAFTFPVVVLRVFKQQQRVILGKHVSKDLVSAEGSSDKSIS